MEPVTHTLQIRGVEVDENSVITCNASNKHGYMLYSAQLFVHSECFKYLLSLCGVILLKWYSFYWDKHDTMDLCSSAIHSNKLSNIKVVVFLETAIIMFAGYMF